VTDLPVIEALKDLPVMEKDLPVNVECRVEVVLSVALRCLWPEAPDRRLKMESV
jgi:hypothetical protein